MKNKKKGLNKMKNKNKGLNKMKIIFECQGGRVHAVDTSIHALAKIVAKITI